MRPLPALLIAAAAAVVACGSRPDVRRDTDPSANLAGYRSFAFFEPPPAAGGYTSLLGQRLKAATARELARHYTHAEHDADLRVHLYLAVVERQELRSTAARPYAAARWGAGLETNEFRQGTLRIDLVDARSRRLVWRGVAEGRLDAKAMEEPGAAIDAAVQEVFAGFPGRAAGLQ